MNQELLQAAITFFKEQHGTYEAMKSQMLQGGIPEQQINMIYEEIKRLGLDPASPNYIKQSIPTQQADTSTGYKPINPQTPVTQVVAPSVSPPTPQTQTQQAPQPLPQNNQVTPPPVATPIQITTPQEEAGVQPAAKTTLPSTGSEGVATQQTPTTPPGTAPNEVQTTAPPEQQPSTHTKVPAFGLILTLPVLLLGLFAYSANQPESTVANIITSTLRTVGLNESSITHYQSLFSFSAKELTVNQNTPPQQTNTQPISTSTQGGVSLAAVVPSQASSTPTTPSIVLSKEFTEAARKQDLAVLSALQIKCLTRYGNAQLCFDGNAYVVKNIIENYDAIYPKTITEKTSYLSKLSEQALSGSDSIKVTISPEKGMLLEGRSLFIDLDLTKNPATCTDKKKGSTVTLLTSIEHIRLCTPKPEILANISCSTFASMVDLCSKGVTSYGGYNSNDSPEVQALLKKYMDSLFAETQ